MARAARETTASGRSERVLAKRPSAIPKMVVTTPATMRARASTRSVWSRSDRSNTSKYSACTEGTGTPTTISAVPCGVRYVWVAAVPPSTTLRSCRGMEAAVTVREES